MERGYEAPKSDGSGQNRANRARAISLFRSAGYDIKNGIVTNAKTGEPLQFEIMVATPDNERLSLVYASMARRAGIEIKVRNVDSSQYQSRLSTYDYDMIVNEWNQSLSPGNEQNFYWGSEAAKANGTRNYMGARNPAIDAMINSLLNATKREDFVSAVRALDRILMSENYVIPLFHQRTQWLAMWTKVGMPQTNSLYGYRSETWWVAK
jgi:peptide/nickel transport system substrate-binding protein